MHTLWWYNAKKILFCLCHHVVRYGRKGVHTPGTAPCIIHCLAWTKLILFLTCAQTCLCLPGSSGRVTPWRCHHCDLVRVWLPACWRVLPRAVELPLSYYLWWCCTGIKLLYRFLPVFVFPEHRTPPGFACMGGHPSSYTGNWLGSAVRVIAGPLCCVHNQSHTREVTSTHCRCTGLAGDIEGVV